MKRFDTNVTSPWCIVIISDNIYPGNGFKRELSSRKDSSDILSVLCFWSQNKLLNKQSREGEIRHT